MIPFNGLKNLGKNNKQIPQGLRLASNHWQKELKEERETNPLGWRLASNQRQKEKKRRIRKQFLKDSD